MNFRRVGVVALKLLTSVGFFTGLAPLIAYVVANDYLAETAGFGFYVGLFLGIVWSIRSKAVRVAFVTPIMWGVAFFLMGQLLRLITVPEVIVYNTLREMPLDRLWWTRLIFVLLMLSIPVGVLVGILGALARARGKSIKQFLSGV